MKCPNCDFLIAFGNVCGNCGVDTVLFTKTVALSDFLYNKGLEQIKNNDLSSAIGSLNKSIQFNKNNIEARNLLGLANFQIGRVGEALKQWVISQSLKKDDNLATEYIQKAQNNASELEKYNDSIKMYNQALAYIKQKSEDMAIIQLKKAIELNPTFVDALNLLSFCYLIQKEKERSGTIISKVLTIDVNNSIALNYSKEISAGKPRIEATKNEPKTKEWDNSKINYPLTPKDRNQFGNNFHLSEIISFIVGCACAFAVFYILIMPSVIEAKDTEISDLKNETALVQSTLDENNQKNDSIIKELESENASLKDANVRLEERLVRQEKIDKINGVSKLISENNIEEAANVLNSLDVSNLPIDVVEQYEEFKLTTYPKVITLLYNNAVRNYRNREYDECKDQLKKALVFATADNSLMDDIIYYQGLAAVATEEIDAAISYFETVINDYSSSNSAYNARRQLSRIQ